MKNSIVLATAVAAVLTSGIAAADLSGNAGVFSNYIWRGVTQTSDNAAGQGGIDWSDESGLYAGTWLSTITNGQELDVYAGFAGEAGDIGYDVGVVTYQYPKSPEFNFTELYASGTFSLVTVGVAYTIDAANGNDGGVFDSGDLYVNGSLDYTVGKSDVSLYAGSYMFDNDGGTAGSADYSHYGASLSKDGFTFAVDKNDIETGDTLDFLGATNSDAVRFTVSYSKDFAL
jgi:uncharacterized protein (TIGR02001 family)